MYIFFDIKKEEDSYCLVIEIFRYFLDFLKLIKYIFSIKMLNYIRVNLI